MLTRLFDVTATKDWTNCVARADVVVDGTPLLRDVPVTYLLFLEKQLVDLHTFVKKLPVLDAVRDLDTTTPSADSFATEPVQTTRTKKVPRNHVKAEATEKHPAQVEVYYEDVARLLDDGQILRRAARAAGQRAARAGREAAAAVKFAREEANAADVTRPQGRRRHFRLPLRVAPHPLCLVRGCARSAG